MKKILLLIVFTISISAIGIAIGYKRYFPIPLLIDLRNHFFTPQDNLTVGDLIPNKFNTPHRMPTVNQDYQYLYSELPVSYQINSSSCPSFSHFLLNNRRFICNELKYLESGIRSYSILLQSNSLASKKLIIYNHGHGGLPVFTEKFAIDFINHALEDGYDILLTSMPFLGTNRRQGDIFIKTFDGVALLKTGVTIPHNIFEGFDLTTSNYLRFFVDDASFFLNEKKEEYSSVSYVGHSGGAWTGVHICSMYSDVINKCFLSSGVMTYDIRIENATSDIGDAEQISYTLNKKHPISKELKKSSEKTDITLYYNTNDVCCFNGIQPQRIKDKLQGISPNINVIIDSNHSHSFDATKALHFIKG